jgi:hypothetical protein
LPLQGEGHGCLPGRIALCAKGQGPSLHIEDPDGHVIELKEPPKNGALIASDGISVAQFGPGRISAEVQSLSDECAQRG